MVHPMKKGYASVSKKLVEVFSHPPPKSSTVQAINGYLNNKVMLLTLECAALAITIVTAICCQFAARVNSYETDDNNCKCFYLYFVIIVFD